jgi:hypothetical protein
MDNANHTSTKRAIRWALRRVCMGRLLPRTSDCAQSYEKFCQKAVICHMPTSEPSMPIWFCH